MSKRELELMAEVARLSRELDFALHRPDFYGNPITEFCLRQKDLTPKEIFGERTTIELALYKGSPAYIFGVDIFNQNSEEMLEYFRKSRFFTDVSYRLREPQKLVRPWPLEHQGSLFAFECDADPYWDSFYQNDFEEVYKSAERAASTIQFADRPDVSCVSGNYYR